MRMREREGPWRAGGRERRWCCVAGLCVVTNHCCRKEEGGTRKSRTDSRNMSSLEDVNSEEKRRRRKGKRWTRGSGSDEDASWEGVRRGGEEEESEMHYLLPLKTRRGLVHQPAVPKPTGTHVSMMGRNGVW